MQSKAKVMLDKSKDMQKMQKKCKINIKTCKKQSYRNAKQS